MLQRTLLSITVILTLMISAQTMAEAPLRKRLTGGNNLPTTDSGWKIPGGRIVEGTANAMSSARDRLAFWKKDRPSSNSFIEGTGRFFRPDIARREQENARKPLSFVRPATWFEPVEEPSPGPQSVHDWIGQPRPGFDN